jgi:hypothetical protein
VQLPEVREDLLERLLSLRIKKGVLESAIVRLEDSRSTSRSPTPGVSAQPNAAPPQDQQDEIARRKADLRRVETEMRAIEAEMHQVPENDTTYADLLRQRDEHSERYGGFRAKWDAALTSARLLDQEALGREVEVLARAPLPVKPYATPQTTRVLTCLLAGIAVGSLLAFVPPLVRRPAIGALPKGLFAPSVVGYVPRILGLVVVWGALTWVSLAADLFFCVDIHDVLVAAAVLTVALLSTVVVWLGPDLVARR